MAFDFRLAADVKDWAPIDDVVMGGRSCSRLEPTPEGTAVFTGVVSLDNGGGFASIRSKPRTHDFARYLGISIRVRGDGRRYKLNLKTDRKLDGVLYRVVFPTLSGTWHTLDLPFDSFEPTFRGRVVPDVPPLDPAHIVSFGLMIADRQEGPFRIEVAWIRAIRQSLNRTDS